jgi:hypothetical protein
MLRLAAEVLSWLLLLLLRQQQLQQVWLMLTLSSRVRLLTLIWKQPQLKMTQMVAMQRRQVVKLTVKRVATQHQLQQ